MDRIWVVKTGGQLLETPDQWQRLLMDLANRPDPFILVHGGGNYASTLTRALGGEPRMINGRRITTDLDLQVAIMVYAGLINKKLVAFLQGCNRPAIGLSGADGNAVQSIKRRAEEHDFGWVGDIISVNAALFLQLIQMGYSPVCCAITHDGGGQLLNTNADTIAAAIAKALVPHVSVHLRYLFDKPGVLYNSNDVSSMLPNLSHADYIKAKETNIFHTGMLPKLQNAFDAVQSGVASVRITNPENWVDGGTLLSL